MNVLIIEDDLNKKAAISNYISQDNSINICYRASYHSGLREILSKNYDLLLLDMSMPAYDVSAQDSGGRPLALAGRDILFQLRRRNISIPVIVVTQYEDFDGLSLSRLDSELRKEFSYNYVGYVYYSITIDDWKTKLSSLLNKIKEE